MISLFHYIGYEHIHSPIYVDKNKNDVRCLKTKISVAAGTLIIQIPKSKIFSSIE